MDASVFLGVSWLVPVLLKVLFGNFATPYLNKSISTGLYLPQKLALQFLFASIFTFAVAASLHQLVFTPTTVFIGAIGIANAWAVLAQWKAHAVSLSRTSFFMVGNGILAMALTTVFLGEYQILGTSLVTGIVLSFGAALLLAYSDFQKRGEKSALALAEARQFYLAVFTYTVIWGFANFLMKYWSLQVVPMWTYLSSWYVGSLIGALTVVWFLGRKEGEATFGTKQITLRDAGRIAALSVALLASLGSLYWSHFCAPQLVLFPLFLAADLIAPIAVGFLFFKEHKKLNPFQLFCLGLAVLGGALVAFTMTS